MGSTRIRQLGCPVFDGVAEATLCGNVKMCRARLKLVMCCEHALGFGEADVVIVVHAVGIRLTLARLAGVWKNTTYIDKMKRLNVLHSNATGLVSSPICGRQYNNVRT